MNASVCVMVTVPTELEEKRQRQLHSKFFIDASWNAPSPKIQSHNSRALQLEDLPSNAPLEQVVRRIATQLRLENVFWSHDVTAGQLQARFDLLQDERYERLLCTLQDWGIGERTGTHVTAINCLETRVKLCGDETATGAGATAGVGAATETETEAGQRVGWQSFMDSVRCRLNVNQVVRVVRRDATINFDFVVLLMAAALLSCVGLVENSFLFLSSSMLISPLMGPIIAGIFGSVIGDRHLRWLGIKNELIGLAISVLTGFVFGAAICLCGLGRFFMLARGFNDEIMSRCDTHSLVIGLCTALASGAAAAIGVLGGNTGSLVGVAISASLLPPAVNAGLLLAIALGTQVLHMDAELLQGLSKHRVYSQHLHVELFVCATVSMALTLLNVICVWLMGVVVLRIKEVAPAVQRDQQFWRHDVRLAREVALNDPQLHSAIDRLDLNERRQVDVDAPHYQHTWSPGSVRPSLTREGKDTNESSYHTVHGFQDFCITLHKLNGEQQRSASACTAAKPKLPKFMEVFKPLETVECTPVAATDPPQLALSQLPSGSRHRSLPDLTQAITEREEPRSEPETKPKLKAERSVHWRQESSNQIGQLPLQDRRLQLLGSRQSSNSTSESSEHEFNV